ncbi:MAG: glycine oxidase ThiO [Dehalococcoidia bacterium]
MQVVVIGGGVIGSSIAYYLRRAEIDVTIVERGRSGGGASAAAAGMLAPLAESPDPGPFTRLALAGLHAFKEQAEAIIAESGIDFEYRRDGVLRVAESDAETAPLQALLAWQAGSGVAVQWLDGPEVHRLEPAIAARVLGALYTPGEGHVNPARLNEALATAAVHRGAHLIEGSSVEELVIERDRVTSVRHTDGHLNADYVVFAAGAWAGLWQQHLQLPLPVFPVRGQMAAVGQTPPPIRHIVYSRDGYLVPKADGSIFIGATEEEAAGYDPRVTVAGLRWLLSAAERLVPVLSEATYLRSWAGLRPCSADHLPLLGPLPTLANVSLATGHFRNGILLSLITGQLIAQQISSGKTPPELLPFSPARFLQPEQGVKAPC